MLGWDHLRILVRGIAASPGTSRGFVVKAFSPQDALDMIKETKDPVLVTPFTDPTWTPVFPSLKAVVTDIGGMLSHAAIVARELGIPAVVGSRTATSTLEDGECVVVDGSRGVVYDCDPTV